MSADLAPIASKLQPLIRMLSSDQMGEVFSAVQAIKRVLESAGLDLHELAGSIGRPNGSSSNGAQVKGKKTYTEEEVLTIYHEAVAEGRTEVERSTITSACSTTRSRTAARLPVNRPSIWARCAAIVNASSCRTWCGGVGAVTG
jgi:hypothetical protein